MQDFLKSCWNIVVLAGSVSVVAAVSLLGILLMLSLIALKLFLCALPFALMYLAYIHWDKLFGG